MVVLSAGLTHQFWLLLVMHCVENQIPRKVSNTPTNCYLGDILKDRETNKGSFWEECAREKMMRVKIVG